MRASARFVMISTLVVWVGAIVFFSFVVAPTVFSVLPAKESAGVIVGRSLAALHRIGLICGIVFVAATFLTELKRAKALRALICLMVLLTAVSQFGVTPQMERIRENVGGSIQALPPQDAGRAAFDRLHQMSVVLESIVLLSGIGAIALVAREERA
ncbi:MAG TPA: DUF4149 domain-containing protein [Terriglobales bacterium]|jgi:hypothetical protein|nr:DUF4149 domain-containing protein [Terriglobales bacterium]